MEERPISPRSVGCIEGKKNQDPLLYKRYFSKYRTVKKLGEGSFGKVYKAEYKNEYFAIKFEDKSKGQNLLESEATIMNYLQGPNIPIIKSFGYSGDYNILVMQLMDKSLEELFNKKHKFSIKTTALLAYQMLTVLQYIHDRHIIHRDIKPDNFVMGANELNSTLYLLDFGLAKKYRSSKTLEQNPYIKKKKLTGTARYASIHALEEMEQSRRDDLESIGYVLMYFLRGNLPWQGLKVKSKENRYAKILEKKKETTSEQLCKNFPEEFKDFLEYAKNLEYTEQPKYDLYKSKFFNLVVNQLGESFDYIYDWTTEHDLRKRKNDLNSNIFPCSELKTTFNKDSENVKSKKKLEEPFPNEEGHKLYENCQNNENKMQLNEENDENVKVDEGKVNSKCCLM